MKRIFVLLTTIIAFCVHAQKTPHKAERLYQDYSFVEAAQAYEEFLSKEASPSDETLEHAAESYYFIGDKSNAAKWFQQLYSRKKTAISEASFYRYIAALESSGQSETAQTVANEYLSQHNPARLDFYNSQKAKRDSIDEKNALYEVKNLEINSDKSDFGTSFFGNRIVYASSKNLANQSQKIYNWNQQPFLQLYVADVDSRTGNLFNDQLFLPQSDNSYHEATVSFSPDLQQVYFSRSITKRKSLVENNAGTNNFKITRGKLFNNKVVNAEDLDFSSVEYSVGHPNISPDGKWIYFSSDMPGGYGEADIYRASIGSDGKIGTPENLGSTINSPLNDVFPFFVNETLYFASEGHFGYGGLDVFKSKMNTDKQFSGIQNLGKPINSAADDFAYIINKEETSGYFSSNREGGKGDDDMYYFSKKALCNQDITGLVTNVRTKAPIAGATVKAYLNSGGAIIQATSDENGFYRLNVPCQVKIKLLASKPGFNVEFAEVNSGSQNQAEIKNVNFELVRYEDLIVRQEETEKIDINPIFFDYNKSNINKQAAIELDKVVYALNKFPEVVIKIETHTDSRGKDDYNLRLSDERAKSSYKYLLEKGIDPSRIESVTGFGESRIINKCKNGVKCTDEEHLNNRRSDFIVVKK